MRLMLRFASRPVAQHARIALAVCFAMTLTLVEGDHAFASSQSAPLGLTAQVVASCSVNASASLNFGTITSPIVGPAYASGSIQITCSMGSSVYLTLGQGLYPALGSSDAMPLRQMATAGTDRLSYQVYADPTYSAVVGNTQPSSAAAMGNGPGSTVMLYARIPVAPAVAPGPYQDTLVATVFY